MRILFITLNINGRDGIIPRKIARGLSKYNQLDVLTTQTVADAIDGVQSILEFRYTQNRKRHRWSVGLFGIDLYDIYWALKVSNKIINKYDVVLCYTGFTLFAPLVVGNMIAKKQKIKLMAYAVDAIPAPLGWSKNDLYFRGVNRFVRKYFTRLDFLASANPKMLDYQLSLFTPKKNMRKEVFYVPGLDSVQIYEQDSSNPMFLYAGSIYGARKAQYILSAFGRLLDEYPTAKLVFVGSKLSEEMNVLNARQQKQVEMYPFTDDLSPFYKKATALLDIDADLENDIYLSSKIINYVFINRIIICETGLNSPSRQLFRGIPSIIQCQHDSTELAEAMRKAIVLFQSMDFSDRENIVRYLELGSMISQMQHIIEAQW